MKLKSLKLCSLSFLAYGFFSFSNLAMAEDLAGQEKAITTADSETKANAVETSAIETRETSEASQELSSSSSDHLDHTPHSCSESMIDRMNCMIDSHNVGLLKQILVVFSMKKGERVIFTTEKFEEIIKKMRHDLKISKADLEDFKNDPKKCIDKLLPVVELISKAAEIELDQDLTEEFCIGGSLLMKALSLLSGFTNTPREYPVATATSMFALLGGGMYYSHVKNPGSITHSHVKGAGALMAMVAGIIFYNFGSLSSSQG
jgi:hypothetical protein